MSILGLVWVMELYSEVGRCMKPYLVALTLLLGTMNRPGLRRLGRGTYNRHTKKPNCNVLRGTCSNLLIKGPMNSVFIKRYFLMLLY